MGQTDAVQQLHNQWQTNVNGPVIKNKTFFDFNYEGVHSILPSTSRITRVPSPQFQAATLANIAGNGNADELPFYRQVFAVYNGASGVAGATPAPTAAGASGAGCPVGFTSLGAGVPCALQFRSTPGSLLTEYQWSARVDQIVGEHDRAYIRLERDNGFPTELHQPAVACL